MFNSYVKIQEGDNVQLPPHSEKILRPKQKGLAQTPKTNDIYIYIYGSVSKPCTPGEHQNSW